MKPNFTKKLIVLSILLLGFVGYSQEYTPFTRTYPSGDNFRYQTNIKGDLTIIGNQILNRDGNTTTTEPEDGYNNLSTDNNNNWETGGRRNYNDYKNMQNINVDPGGGRFNSSTTTFNFPQADCNIIRYAGLYWSATYPSDTANGSYGGTWNSYVSNTIPVGNNRQNDFNQVQFRVPGGNYVNITADEVLFDGFTSTDPSVRQNSPYACYADVTALVTALADPTGDYTVANIRATTGGLTPGGGSTGGWTLVIVYENPTLTGKLITTFDGFARVNNGNSVNINYNGFTTIPAGPVIADIGAATLEGDFRITGDGMSISSAGNFPTFTPMSNGSNPANNFFNSNITLNGAELPGRNPSSLNTLGFDADIFNLNNFSNSVIQNGETAATFRFSTGGDQYYPFFNSFNIEIIEPEIVLEKRVEDIAGNDITGQGVNLGQVLDYVLSFRNIGNDDGDNYTIRDVLPINVTLNEGAMVLPPGVTYTYDEPTRTVVFTIPNNLIEVGDPTSSIRMRVRVAENCFDFIDACTDLIQNLAFSTYQGVFNNNPITDDPSVTEFNNCTPPIPGATNFLLDDLENCNFTRTVQLCGDDVLLDAGDNFDTYVWVSDDNNNGLYDATDTVLQTGTSDTFVVDQEGTYIVDKIVADPCKGFKEVFVVERFGSNSVNPIIDYFNTVNADADVTNDIEGEIVTCSIDGDQLAKIFLCGAGDSQILQSNITDAQTISWEQLDEGSCSAAPDDCANKNASCGWNQIATGSTHTVTSAGKFRLVVTYQNGCFNRFYFDVYQNNLNIEYNTRDIICTTDGFINITNLGSNYGFELIDITNNNILVPFSANNGPNFSITSNGQYRVDVVQLDSSGNPIPNACIFSTPEIGIRDRDFQVDIETTAANCNSQGTIKIDILNVEPNYTYTLRQSDGTLIDDETAQVDNTHTFNVNAGDYIIEAASDDGCTFSQNVTVARTPDPTLSALLTRDIGCSAGMITMTAADGFPNPDYGFAIWSKDGVSPYTTIADIPGSAYQVEEVFTFGWRDTDFDLIDEYFAGEDGTYVFVVVDANDCFAFSNPVTITDNGAMTIAITDDSNVSCSGSSDAGITIVPTGGVGPYSYSIDAGTNTQTTPTFVGLSAGIYDIQVTDSSGCTIDTTHEIIEPFPLSASAGVSRDATCDPNGAEVRITNVTGGTAPYEYSFDGGGSYGVSTTATLPPGSYTLIVRDATTCTFPMNITVEGEPTPPTVSLTPEVNYNCDGTGTITATPDITTYNYTYELDGVLNSPDPTSNIFPNVAPGTYTIRTNYIPQTTPAPSLLLQEDFGSGLTIQNPNTTGYFYEEQTTTTNPNIRPGDTDTFINDYEYAVTSSIVNPFGVWINPNDRTSNGADVDGRYLVINIGAPTTGQVIYQKTVNDIIPNRPLDVSLWLINLLRNSSTLTDPDLTIELRDTATNAVVATANTGAVPKNESWNEYVLSLNPGANTSLNLVITTNESEINGNDVAIDDISVFQDPEVCEQFVETTVTVDAGRVFTANRINSTNVSCNGLSDGTITFEVENFNATAGFDYSVDGGTTYINATTSPVTTAAIYGSGSHTILIRKTDENSCTTSVTATITEPAILVADASVTTDISCTNGGATITASASGGIPTYEYQLEDTLGGILTAYQTTTTFTGIAAGDYIIRVRDVNLCVDPIDVPLTVAPTNTIVFDIVATNCYSGANDATIQVNVTDGNGDYTFSINGGPWITPTPANATTHTFANLSNGNYTINVSDGSGCIGTLQNVTINPELTVTANAANITACGTSTDIDITANGGDTNYVYAVVPNGNAVVDGDFSTTNPVAVTAAGDYDVHVRDNGGAAGYCSDVFTITIVQDAPIAITPTPTPVTCFGGSDGAINIIVDSGGFGPFEFSIDNGATYDSDSSFVNLSAGTYQVRVRDANACETTAIDVVVAEPAQLVAEAILTQDYTCNQLGQITVGSVTATSGGSGDYQYSINGGAWTTATTGGHTFVDLTDGTYTIRVRDANAISCETTLTDIIINPLPVEPVLTTAVDYNCDGTGDVTVTPFDAAYTYILDGVLPGQTGTGANVFADVAVGTHTITVNYGSDCTIDTTVIVEPGNAFEASITAFENLDCNADNSGTITITANNFGASGFEYSIDGGSTFIGPFSSAEQITGLSAQVHNIIVRDVDEPIAGCTVNLSQTLTEPTAIVADASITEQFTCDNTGATITASATGGTPTYEYQLEDTIGTVITAYQTTTTFTNLPAGDYIVRARDNNLCSDPIDTAITVVAPVNPTFTTTPTACYSGANDASILVDVTSVPGNGGFQFSINGGPFVSPTPTTATTYTFNNLANGTYTIDVRDGFGCNAAQQTVTINPELTVTANAANITACGTSTDIDITANGGDTNYVYAVVPNGNAVVDGDFSTTNPVAVTAAGDYDVHVRDNGGAAGYCSDVFTITIVQDAPIAITPTPTPVTCFGGSDGAINIIVDSGGFGPFEFSIDNGATYDSDSSFVNLSAGTYQVRVRDANACETTAIDVVVAEPAQLVAEAILTQDYTCNQLGQITVGSVTATSGGSGDYQYSINGGAWTTATTGGHTFVDLTDGTYTIRVRDANAISCETTLTDIIINPLPVEPVLTTAVDYNCDGTGDVTVTPFDAAYTYILDGVLPGQTGTGANVFADVAVGTHTITVNYGSDCTIDTTVIVEPGNAFEASITAFENLDCNADNSGTITITANNFGASGFEYSIDGGSTFIGPFSSAEQITGLSAQVHNIIVRDVDEPIAGCTVNLSQTLTEPTALVADASITEQFTCDNTGATITASATGGTPTYEYQLEDTIGTVITAYQTTTTFTNLPAGDYIVRARDNNLCSDPIDTAITVVAPVNPTFTTTPTACYSGANDASILVDVTSVPGNGGFQFSINGGPFVSPTPTTATTYTFNNLANGTYTIDVRDGFGCNATQQTVTINPELTAVVDVQAVTNCADGTITVTPTGGDANYSYAYVLTGTPVSATDFGPSNTYTVTAGNDGDYDIYVWDNAAGTPHCEYMETVTVDPATAIAFTATPNDPECHDGVGSIDIAISSGDIPYQIRIVDLDNAGASNQTATNILAATHSFYNLLTGEYEVYVQDANGCETQLTPNITINNPDELTATITPILPAACGSVDPNDYGFQFVGYPTTYPPGTTIEFSADGGATWTGDDSVPGTTDQLMGYISGTSVFPSMRTVVGGVEICRTDLPRYIIPYPLDDLDISISTVVVGCNELQVTVQGTAGVPNYEYTFADDPSTFNIATATWTAPIPGAYTWTGLVPGRTYVFYVRDNTGCVRQSNVNVNDITTNPLEITATYEPSCSGANDAEITYTITDTDATTHPSMRWEFYNANTGALVQTNAGHPAAIPTASTITVSGLAPGEYYIVVTEVDASNVDACVSGSENLIVDELNPITASLNKLSDISCSSPGLIAIENINGGGGTFTYTVTGPAPFTTITATSDNPVSIPANSPAGNYNVTITDQYGCFTDLGPINLDLTPNPTIDSMVVDNCATPTSLTINATSTAAQILYSIDGGTNYEDNGGVFNNLATGTYAIAIIDSNGCTDTDSIEIFPVLEANVTLTKLIDCTVSPDAEITIDVTFGSSSYDYEITNGLGSVVARTALPTNPFVFATSVPEDYTITIYDNGTAAPECNRVFNVTIPAAVIPAFTEVHEDVTCNGSTDGTITLTETSNGINPLTYTITPAAGSFNAATNTFENLPVGTYTVTGTGTNNCTFDITGIVIDEPAPIVIPAPTVVEFGCTVGNNSNNASITINSGGIVGGSSTYVRYEFINDQGTPATGDDVIVQDGSSLTYTETNTAGGTYIINAYDDNGCIGTNNATILPFVEISNPTVTITQDLTCNPGDDAEVTIGIVLNPSTATPTLAYSIVGTDNAYSVLNQATNAFTAIGVGNYEVTVENTDTGCIVQTAFEIEDPNTFEIATTVTDVVCFGDDGTVSFTISDAINPYAGGFSWQIYLSQGTDDLLDDVIVAGASGTSANLGPTAPFAIGAGEYRVEITQDSDPSCVNNERFVIAGPSAAITANTDVTPITCVGNDGVIEIIDVVGGWGDYQYYVGTVAPTVVGDYVATPRFENLAPGTYQAWVIDQNGCQQEVQNTIVLADPTPIDAQLQLNQPNCPNFAGEIQVINVTGGQGSNYTYQLIKDGTPIGAPQNTTVFSGLDAGSYTVQIDDQWSCTFTTTAMLLYEPIVPLATVVKTIDCTVDPGGQITITQTGGSGNFDYLVTFPDLTTTATNTTGVFTTLTQVGDYVFTITDQDAAHACPVTITQNLQDRIIPVLTIDAFTNVTCNTADDGTITVSTVDNGVGPYTFEIIAGPGSTATFPMAPTSNTNTSAVFEGLEGNAAGITYTIRATGANNCTEDITQVITQPDAIANVNATVVEFGCTTGNNSDFATITIDQAAITGGSGTYVRYEFINDQGTPATGDDVVVQDGTNNSYTETDFAGGTYIINVYDDRGCIGTTNAAINPFDELLPATLTVDNIITCANSGEDVTINAFGSLTDSSTPAGLANYEFRQLPSGTFQASNQFTNLPVGNYAFEVRNVNTGCIVSITHTVEDPNTFEIATTVTDVVCFGDDGTVSFTISDAINPYAGGFSWQIYLSQGTDDLLDDVIVAGASGTSANLGPTAPFAIGAGEYRVEITQDSDPSCVNNERFVIAGPSAAITANTDVTPITCVGNDGVIEIIDVVGGWGDYQYYVGTVAPTVVGDYVATPRFENLAPGTYQAWVIDQNGCQQEVQNTIVLADPTPIDAQLQLNQPNCPNFAGEIQVINVTGGQGSNYTYQLIKDGTPIGAPQNTTVFSGLDAGSYTVQIDDQWSCTFTTTAMLLYEPIVPLATVVKTIDCTVDPGGQITITQTGGSGNFDYLVTFPDLTTTATNTTGVFTTLTQVGDYVFTITDQDAAHACPVTITQNLQDRIIPVLTIDAFTNVTCNTADDGTITVSTVDNGVGPYTFEIIAGPGSTATFPMAPTSNTNTSAVFEGLEGNAAGITYTIRATGANNCTEDITQVITQPDAIANVNATVVEFGCTTGNNSDFATITIDQAAITGGSGTYVRYEFINDQGTPATGDDVVVQDGTNNSYTETDFAGGTYIINVYDDRGCIGTTNAAINPFDQISDATVTTLADVTCNPGNDGQIQVGVTVNPATATPNLEFNTTGSNVVYNQTNTSGLFSGLEIGNYVITVTNLDTGCIVQTTYEILDPDVIEVIATKLTDEECLNNGVDDGSFSVTINNYTGNYSYQVYDNNDVAVVGFAGTGNTTTPLIISNLPGGVYYVRITETDAPFCEEDSNRVTIIAPEFPVSVTVSEQASPSCTDDQGSILVDPEGGVAPYTITLTNTTTSQTYTETNVDAFIFSGLSGGNFDISVTDAMSCPITDTITLVTPDALVPTIVSTNLVCYNDNTASVTASVNTRNVTPNYLYQLNRYDATGTTIVTTSANQTSNTFTGLNAGFYSITVNDDVSCSEETPIVEITNPTQVEAQLIRTSPLTCATGVELLLSATGGSGTYEYSVDDINWIPMTGNTAAIPNASITGPLGAGVYRYFVRDAVNTCASVQSNEISEDAIEPLILTLDTSAAFINCNGDNTASIYASATGGLGNYMYELYTDVSLNPVSRIAGPQSLGEFSNLGDGTYYVNVLSDDCTTPARQVIITEPTPLDYTDEVTNALCFGDENGTITVELSGGSDGYQYAISPNLNQFDDENTFDGLAPGDYTVIAQDQNGCFIELQYTITQPELLTVSATGTPEVCFGDEDGTINLTIEGGTAPYSTMLSTESNFVQDRTSFNGLPAGIYIILVRDANGCETDTAITIEAGANLNATVEPIYECTGDTPSNYVNITLEDSSVLGDVLYALDSTDPNDMQLNPDFRNTAPGSHFIAIAHANGCIRTIDFEIENFEPLTLSLEQSGINRITATAAGGKENYTFIFDGIDNGSDDTFIINRTDTYVVTIIDENGCQVQANIFMEFIDIEIPNFFTPDGDGQNDVWMPRNQEAFPEILTIIFDRYGREVYRLTLNTPGWDGLYKQSELPTGDYWYVIKLRGERDSREFVGHFTLYR